MSVFSNLRFYLGNLLGIRMKPRVLQLPITDRCNSRCQTCNVWKKQNNENIDVERLREILNDPFFSKLEGVGINGGEPFLHPQFLELVEMLAKRESIRNFYIISNGLLTKEILRKLRLAKAVCSENNVRLDLMLSMDGKKETYGLVRGVPDGYEKVVETIRAIMLERERYCDRLEIGYTISRHNATDMQAVQAFAQHYAIPVFFHLAVPNKRLCTFDAADYSVLNDSRSAWLAMEFFFARFEQARSIREKMQAFLVYDYLRHGGKRRLAVCNYKNRDVTINEKCELYLCAAASGMVAALQKCGDASVQRRSGAIRRERKNVKAHCAQCIHYATVPSLRGLFAMAGAMLSKRVLVYDMLRARILGGR